MIGYGLRLFERNEFFIHIKIGLGIISVWPYKPKQILSYSVQPLRIIPALNHHYLKILPEINPDIIHNFAGSNSDHESNEIFTLPAKRCSVAGYRSVYHRS